MSDFTLCKGDDCPIKNNCFRFRGKPFQIQSYFAKIPFDDEGNDCQYYISIENFPDAKLNQIKKD